MPPTRKRPAAAGATGAGEGRPGKKAKVEGLYSQYKEGSIPEPRIARVKAPAGSFKAISWNVAGLRAFLEKRGEDLKKLVKEEKPAVIGFLEHKLQPGEQVEKCCEALTALLPDYIVEASAFACSAKLKGYSGVALIWRKDLAQKVKVKAEKLEKGASEGRTLCMELPHLFLVLCYVPNSGDALGRLKERVGQWDPRLRSYLQGLARKKPVLLMGDLNVAHRDADIWNLEAPHVPRSAATTPEERASFGQLLSSGFVDGFAALHEEALGAFTYWSVRARNRQPNRGLRLDYALASEGLARGGGAGPRLLDTFHLPSYAPSGDHCPIGATVSGVC